MTSQKVLDWWLEMPPPDEELVFDDGEPMDSPEHRANAAILVDVARKHYEARDDVYVGANEALYFSSIQAKNRDFRAPDFFVVLGCDGKAYRKGWVVWNEGGKVPDLIIELLSPTTEDADRTVKFDTYRRLNVGEYVLFDVLTDSLEGYTLENRNYVPMPTDNHGHLKCASLGLSLGLWPGDFQGTERNWLRFFHPDGRIAPTFAEAESQRAEAESQRAEAESQRAEAESQRAKAESQRAEAESQRAEAESQRAAAEAKKNADLLARLAAYESRFGSLAPSGDVDP